MFLSFLNLFSYQTIYVAKWFITPLFVLVYWFIQRRFLLLLFQPKKNCILVRRIISFSIFTGRNFFAAGWLLGKTNDGYTFSRLFMGLLLSRSLHDFNSGYVSLQTAEQREYMSTKKL